MDFNNDQSVPTIFGWAETLGTDVATGRFFDSASENKRDRRALFAVRTKVGGTYSSALVEDGTRHRNGRPPTDDMTILAFRSRPEGSVKGYGDAGNNESLFTTGDYTQGNEPEFGAQFRSEDAGK